MASYDERDLAEALRAAGLEAGDVVLVHSALFALGRLRGMPVREIPAVVHGALARCVGSNGTIVVPAFNFGFCRGEPFDRLRTPADGMGVLSEFVRRHPESVRSKHPMQSVAAVGRRARAICEPDTASAFDPHGSFGELLRRDAKLVLLGASIDAASLVHYAEQQVAVPYRSWKSFTGPYIDGDVEERRTYRMYVRDASLEPRLRLAPVEAALRARSRLGRATVGSGRVLVCRSRDFVDATVRLLRADDLCLLENAGRVRPILEARSTPTAGSRGASGSPEDAGGHHRSGAGVEADGDGD